MRVRYSPFSIIVAMSRPSARTQSCKSPLELPPKIPAAAPRSSAKLATWLPSWSTSPTAAKRARPASGVGGHV